MKIHRVLSFILLCSLISGCSIFLRNTVDNYVNDKFPPIDYSNAKKEAVARSHSELRQIITPSLLFNVPTATLKEGFNIALNEYRSEEIKILSATIEPEEQGIRFITNIEGTIGNPKGKFEAKVEGWGVVSLEHHTAIIRPVMKSARITKVKIKSWNWAAKPVSDVINGVLKRYIDNINGQIKPIAHKIDPKSIGMDASPITIELSPGKTATIPGVSLGPSAVLIDKEGLHLLAQIDVDNAPPTTSTITENYIDYQEEFWNRTEPVRSGQNRYQTGLFLSNELLTNLLDPVFTPLELESLQQIALENTFESINTEGIVAAGAAIKGTVLTSTLTEFLKTVLSDSETIDYGEPTVSLSEQTVIIKLPIAGRMQGSQIAFKGEITAAGIIANDSGQLYYRLLLISMDLNEAEHLGGVLRLTPFVSSVNELLTQLIPYVNGALNDEPIKIDLPQIKPIPVAPPGVQILPAELSIINPGAVVLLPRVNAAGLGVLVVVAPESDSGTRSIFSNDLLKAQQTAFSLRPGTGATIEIQQPVVTPEQVDQAFYSRWNNSLAENTGDYENNIVGTLSLPWAMSFINETLAANRITVSAHFESEKTDFDSGHLRVADWLQPSCTVGLTCKRSACNRGSCSRPQGKCGWSCRKCISWGFGKTCADDPFCLATRAACNAKEEANVVACNANEESKVAACNIAEETKLGACNVERELQVLGCNIINETIRAIRQLDSIGRFNGDAKVKGLASIGNTEILYDAQTSKLDLIVDASVSLDINGSLGFIPADIGHILVCPIKGSVNFTAGGRFLPGRTKLSAKFVAGSANQDGSLPLEMVFEPVKITGNLSPAPVDALLGQNPHLFVLCNPVVSTIGGIGNLGKVSAYSPLDIFKAIERAIPGNQETAYRGLVAFTTGKVDETVNVPSMKIDIPILNLEVLNKPVTLKPEWKEGHLIYSQ